jgi:GWxTD domain-containing protein
MMHRELSTLSQLMVSLLLLLFMNNCKSSSSAYPLRSARSAMNLEADLPQIETVVFHLNDSVTRVFFKITNENLLYKRMDTSAAFFAHLKVFMEARSLDSPRKIADSLSLFLYDRSEEEQVKLRSLQTSYTCNLRKGNYVMNIICADENRHVRYMKTVEVNKTSRSSYQNFLLLRNDSVHFGNQILVGATYKICYAYPADLQLGVGNERYLLRRGFYPPGGPAATPFAAKEKTEDLRKPEDETLIGSTDSLWSIRAEQDGYLRISVQTSAHEGLSLFTVDESFPGVSSTREMIQCTRYLMSKEEFEKCLVADDPKSAIEKFWLDIGGSQERARELVRKYYNRVKEANKNFSSYMPGWKTDRGMIYIVMGQPYNTLSGENSETWVYGTEANPNALRFLFIRKESACTDMDYTLERSFLYRDPFHQAVAYWRQGLVFNEPGR